MAQKVKIDSNVTGLRIAEEASLKVLPATPDWIPYEPNSYGDFGAEITTVARNPINAGRQRKKGPTTDLDATANFNNDLTYRNMQGILQGFFFADLRRKGEQICTGVTGTGSIYGMSDTSGFLIGALVLASNFGIAGNNGLKTVNAVTASTSVAVDEPATDEGSPPATANLVVVGHKGAAGDLDVVAATGGNLPRITSSALDFTTLGLIPGEWIFVGGDSASLAFSNAENNGFKRIRSISANVLEIDKSDQAMVTESSTTETVQLFFGRVLKNESDPTLQKRRSYQQERTLGAPDDATPADIQAEYIPGCIGNEFTFNMPTADKLAVDLGFIGLDGEFIDGPTTLKSGNRPTIEEQDAFNTSSDFSRIKLSQVVPGSEAPVSLFAFSQEITLSINNNATPNKALGVLGGFEVTVGNFEVGGSITAYFANVAAQKAVRDNDDITLDIIMVKSNQGIAIDLPLLTLGDGRATVELNEPITLPLNNEAASGVKLDANLDHTMLMVFFDYLPNAADT